MHHLPTGRAYPCSFTSCTRCISCPTRCTTSCTGDTTRCTSSPRYTCCTSRTSRAICTSGTSSGCPCSCTGGQQVAATLVLAPATACFAAIPDHSLCLPPPRPLGRCSPQPRPRLDGPYMASASSWPRPGGLHLPELPRPPQCGGRWPLWFLRFSTPSWPYTPTPQPFHPAASH